MDKYRVLVPPTMNMGSYRTIVDDDGYLSKERQALNDYNMVRAYDNLPPLKRMPNGTKYVKM